MTPKLSELPPEIITEFDDRGLGVHVEAVGVEVTPESMVAVTLSL